VDNAHSSFFSFLSYSRKKNNLDLILEFVDILIPVDGRTVFVFLLAREKGDQEDEQAETAEQAEDGDTHGDETGLVGGESIIVFGSAVVAADDDAV